MIQTAAECVEVADADSMALADSEKRLMENLSCNQWEKSPRVDLQQQQQSGDGWNLTASLMRNVIREGRPLQAAEDEGDTGGLFSQDKLFAQLIPGWRKKVRGS